MYSAGSNAGSRGPLSVRAISIRDCVVGMGLFSHTLAPWPGPLSAPGGFSESGTLRQLIAALLIDVNSGEGHPRRQFLSELSLRSGPLPPHPLPVAGG